MIIQGLAFYLFAFVAVAAGVMVISSRNPVHSVLFLILAFFNAAGLFVLMGAEFLAMILVIVYVGAVAVLFLFVVMMLDINYVEMREGVLQYLPIGALIGIVLLAELAVIGGSWVVLPLSEAASAMPTPPIDQVTNTNALGRLVYTHYIYLFQAAGLILLVAMIGAIVLTLRDREGVRRQRISDQVDRKVADTIEIVKVVPGSGV
ncbi:MAG: NADH-quinone oxidoreductase subunit J [Alphaproteobacteria bacterium]|jgi:NADH-quinone oxidoreductase subunit J|nr:NADH-quinone oxidoreductase subunit J [Alphaproteobacteria bacterium]|tara:strand:- start:113 stop:727 length:615 start_codon:yes stop_codon:yes gene_type:complete